MKLHPRYNVVQKAQSSWWKTDSGSARYNYADLFRAFLVKETFPALIEDGDMVEALRKDFLAVCEEHDLTPGERAMLIGEIIQDNAKYLIRWERHEDFGKQGGEA